MTAADYYGDYYPKLLAAETELRALADTLAQTQTNKGLKPVVYFCSRIKQPESMAQKLRRQGLPAGLTGIQREIYDAVGLRIICAFYDDVYWAAEKLRSCPQLTVEKEKDYLAYPKPNGYRSLHLCVRMTEGGIPAEIQLRTIAMDFWASLEHQIKYKTDVPHEAIIRQELKTCADTMASADLSMQIIRELLENHTLE